MNATTIPARRRCVLSRTASLPVQGRPAVPASRGSPDLNAAAAAMTGRPA